MKYYSAIKKKKNLAICNQPWMQLEHIMPSDIRQRKTDTVSFHSCNLRNKMNEQRQKKRDKPRNRLSTIEMVTRREMGGRMGKIGNGDQRVHL